MARIYSSFIAKKSEDNAGVSDMKHVADCFLKRTYNYRTMHSSDQLNAGYLFIDQRNDLLLVTGPRQL